MENLDSLKQSVLQPYVRDDYGTKKMSSERMDIQSEENDRKFAYEQSQRDKLFQIAMQQYQDAYNSPSAQKQRFLAAGINPYLAMYGGAENTTQGMSVPTSHGSSSKSYAGYASADAARVGNIVNASSALNDSVSSFYKNLVTNEEAKQQQFATQTMQERYYNDMQRRVKELRSMDNKNEDEKLELERKENELEDYYKNRPEIQKQVQLQNNFTESATKKNIAEANHADAETQTENTMRDVTRRAAEKGIHVSDATIGSLRNQAMLFYEQAQQISDEQFYMNRFGYNLRFKHEYYDQDIMKQNSMRLQKTFNDFVNELHNKRIISKWEAVQAKTNAKRLMYQTANEGLNVVNNLRNNMSGNKDLGVGGLLSTFLK